jgi:hypothetical protein
VSAAIRWAQWLPWVSLAAFTLLWAARWPALPLALDPSYHLFVAGQVADAGGPIGYEWWEYAPVGRPHLYPPLLHLLLAPFLRMGCAPLTVIRAANVVAVPALLLTLFLVARRLLTPTIGLACLWVGLLPLAFHLQSAVALAATLGMIELLWLMVALEEQRLIAAGLLFALLVYTHLGLPWIALVTMVCYGVLRPQRRQRLLMAGCLGLLAGLPWFWHLWQHRAALQMVPRYENVMLDVMPLVFIIAAAGIWRCLRAGGAFLWIPACWAGFALLWPRFLYRWLSGEGLLPVVLLAGVGADWLAQRIAQAARRPSRHAPLALVCGVLLLSPTLATHGSTVRWQWLDSAPVHLLGVSRAHPRSLDAGVVSTAMESLARVVVAQSGPAEILWSNSPYALGLLAALAHRPTSSAMLDEVGPARALDPLAAAQLIVWFKLEPAAQLTQAARDALHRVAEDELAVIFRRPAPVDRARPPQAVMPLTMALSALALCVSLIVYDLGRPRQNTV